MKESDLIKYWAGMLDESSGPDLSKFQGTNAADVKIIPDDDYESEAEYYSSLAPCQRKRLVRQSEVSLDLANGVYRPEQIVNPELIPEARHSMRGPAAARKDGGIDEIADMREKLANGVVEFTFWKHGEAGQGDVQRHAVGTTSELVVPIAERRRLDPSYDENVASYERRAGFIIWFWDLEKNAVRCFNTNRFDEILNYEPTTARAAPNVERIGNIFIHRDVEGDGVALDDDRIEAINGEIGDMMCAEEPEMTRIFGGGLDLGDVPYAEIERSPGGEPVLHIEIRKRGNDSDQPYQLRINEMRRLIRERFGVDVREVIVDGTFSY